MAALISRLLRFKDEFSSEPFRQPVFVLGCMRSGTSLLQNIITEHPQLLRIGFELTQTWTDIGGADCRHHCNYKSKKDFNTTSAINMTNYYSNYIRKSKNLLRHLARFKNRWDLGSGGIFYDWNNVIPVNKSPHLMNKITYVNSLFQEARFIFIIRSIEAQASSMKTHFNRDFNDKQKISHLPMDNQSCWHRLAIEEAKNIDPERLYPSSFNLIPEAWIRLNALALKELESLGSSKYIAIKYEDLILNQESCIRRVFDFLNLKQEHQKKSSKLALRKRKSFNITSKGNPLDKWKVYLSDKEKEIIQQSTLEFSEGMNTIDQILNHRS